jgi:hypothetical protein
VSRSIERVARVTGVSPVVICQAANSRLKMRIMSESKALAARLGGFQGSRRQRRAIAAGIFRMIQRQIGAFNP